MLDFCLNIITTQAELLSQLPRNKPHTFLNNAYFSCSFCSLFFFFLGFVIYADHIHSRQGKGQLVLESNCPAYKT